MVSSSGNTPTVAVFMSDAFAKCKVSASIGHDRAVAFREAGYQVVESDMGCDPFAFAAGLSPITLCVNLDRRACGHDLPYDFARPEFGDRMERGLSWRM